MNDKINCIARGSKMKNRICDMLGIEKPVIGAAMTWVSDARWVAAISNAGGLGVLGPNCGDTVPTDSPVETGERLRREIRKTRELTDKPFAVNYLLPTKGVEATYTFARPIYKVLKEEKAMCTTISDKVLFASAHPFIELRDALDAYAAFPFTDEVRNKIMYENARKVLKLA